MPPLTATKGAEPKYCKLMCVFADNFIRICNLYPKTMTHIKERGLERREFFLKKYRLSELFRKYMIKTDETKIKYIN